MSAFIHQSSPETRENFLFERTLGRACSEMQAVRSFPSAALTT